MKTIDLHVHSNFSDGTCTPEELILLAEKKKLSAMALTDHDGVGGIIPALDALKKLNSDLEFIPGTELSVDYRGQEIHIVGLYVDYTDKEFIEKTTSFLNRRIHRNEKMIENFQKAGIPVTLKALQKGNSDTVVTRAHFAKFLIENGIVKDAKEAFTDKYLGKNSPLYVPRTYMNSQDAIRLILKAGGIPILAHPMHYKMEDKDKNMFLNKFKLIGNNKSINYNKDDKNILLALFYSRELKFVYV